ncbi:MAG: hypothetical protein GF401_10340 [Chitinivibrionales bacterium]|nr:hypothetical protein [Chitinivibrionales bacterium]
MDNIQQIKEIAHYRRRLSRIAGKDIPFNTAARIWVRKYAKLWRLRHPDFEPCSSYHCVSA